MTDSISATEEAAPSSNSSAASMRIAVLDRDSGFIQVLSKRLDRLGWEHRVLGSPVPTDAIASMRLSALVVDLAVLGPPAWGGLPGPGGGGGCVSGPTTGSPSRATPRKLSPECRVSRVAGGAPPAAQSQSR